MRFVFDLIDKYIFSLFVGAVVDRYVLGLFIRVLVICFITLAGLYCVVDFMNNLQEFTSYGQKLGTSTLAVAVDYYHNRLFWFFDLTSGIFAMMAGVFAITWLQRTNELTALMAAGIGPWRIIKPLVFATITVAGLGVVNRECCLPQMRDKLSRNAQDWLGEAANVCTPIYDNQTGVLIAGKFTFANEKRINSPSFSQFPSELAAWGPRIIAADAYYQAPADGRPGGFLLRNVSQPSDLAKTKSLSLGAEKILFSPTDTPWLKPGECFVASGITFDQLTVGNSWRQYQSTRELLAGLSNKSLNYGADVRLIVHDRFIRPLLDVTLLFLGIPLVFWAGNRNIWLAAGMSLGLMASFFAVVNFSHALGTNYLIRADLAAWLPLLVFAPLGYTFARPLWDSGEVRPGRADGPTRTQ